MSDLDMAECVGRIQGGVIRLRNQAQAEFGESGALVAAIAYGNVIRLIATELRRVDQV